MATVTQLMVTPLASQLAERQVTLESLIVATQLSPQRGAELLAGADPTIDEIRLIASALDINVRLLITGRPNSKPIQINLRENFKASSGIKTREGEKIILQAQEIATILPESEDRRLRVAVDDSRRLEDAEGLAHFCRTALLRSEATGPIDDLVQAVVEHTPISVVIRDLRRIEGCALSISGKDYVFLAKRPNTRMRFTLAHELCHCLVDLEDNSGWFDEDVVSAKGQSINTERFANAFAGALLMPASGTASALKLFRQQSKVTSDTLSDVEIVFLSRFFNVNFQVAARRCEDLQLIPRGASISLYESVKSRYQSPERLADQIGLPKRRDAYWQVGLHKLIYDARIKVMNGDLSVGRLSEILNMNVEEVSARLALHAHLY